MVSRWLKEVSNLHFFSAKVHAFYPTHAFSWQMVNTYYMSSAVLSLHITNQKWSLVSSLEYFKKPSSKMALKPQLAKTDKSWEFPAWIPLNYNTMQAILQSGVTPCLPHKLGQVYIISFWLSFVAIMDAGFHMLLSCVLVWTEWFFLWLLWGGSGVFPLQHIP